MPDVVGDPIGVEAEEELLAEDRREGEGDVSEKDVGGLDWAPNPRLQMIRK